MENDELTQIWKEVEDRVVQMANGDRSQLKRGLDIEGVLLHLEKAEANDKKKNEGSRKVKDVFNSTLACIQVIGESVANIASNAFPPANLCYSALAMVIEAWQGCEGVFEDLALLLTQCGEFLERLSYYIKTEMDAKLTRVACQHLSFFVEICDRALVLRKKHSRIKIIMKQLFLKDSDIQNALVKMANLYSKELGLVTAQTFRLTHETVTNSKDNLNLTQKANIKLDSLVDDRNQQKRKTDVQKWKSIILKTLEFDQSTIDREAEGHVDDWEIAWQNHKTKIIEGSGDWISENLLFRSWVRGSDSASPILGIEGRDGSGKTLVASSIIMNLRKLRGAESSASRSVVAYYFLEPKSKVISDKDNVANSVSRSLLYQLAKADVPFLKSAAGICEKAEFFRNSTDMWKQLLFENEDRDKMDSTMFVVIDGLAESVDALTETFRRISAHPYRHRTRVLLTGQESLFDHLSKVEGIEIDRIKLGKSNIKDIEVYINRRMDHMETLKDCKNSDVSETRAKIMEALKESTDGDYYKLGQDLDNLAEFDEIEEIEAYLEKVGKTRPEHMLALIEKLNQERTPKEIAEINEIILWINNGRVWLTVPQMEAALAFRTGKLVSRSLGSIESKIGTKYSIFRIDDDDTICYDAGDISGMIPVKKRNASHDEGHDGTREILPAEINMISHYLNTVCPPDVYAKFNFDQFFKMKMVRKSNHICSDPDNAHITLALRCMSCLTEQRTSKTKELHGYSKSNIHGHLEATDLSLADRDLKTEAGLLLAKLFTDDYCSDSLLKALWTRAPEGIPFTALNIPVSWRSWVLCEDGVNVMDRWLKDSAVLEKIKDVAWVKAFKSAEVDRHKVLLETASRGAAGRLFRSEATKRGMIFEFLFLSGVLNKATVKRPEKADDTTYLEDLFHPTLDIVSTVEDWSQKCQGITEKDARWEAQAAALLMHLSNEDTPITKKDSEARARKARELDSENWSATHTLAIVTESLVESMMLLRSLVDRLEKDTEWLEEADHQVALVEIMLDLGDRLWQSSDKPDSAIAMYSRSLDFGQAEHLMWRYQNVLWKYRGRELWSTIISLLEKFLTNPNGQQGITGKLVIPLKLDNFEELFSTLLVPTFMATGRWDLLETIYEAAIPACLNYWYLYYLRNHYAKALLFRGDSMDTALSIWEKLFLQDSKPSEAIVRSEAVNSISSDALPSFIMKAFPKDAEPIKEYCNKIETFYKDFSKLTYQDTDARICYARYFHLRGDDLQARKLIKETVVQCLEMLSDDTLDNDIGSFWDLGRVFSIIEDFTNAHVAWEMMDQSAQVIHDLWVDKKAAKGLADASAEPDVEIEKAPDKPESEAEEILQADADSEDAKSETSSESEEEEEEPPLSWVSCDNCYRDIPFMSEAWTCLDEGGTVQLDEECYSKLQEGTLEKRVCNKNHHHYHAGKRDGERLAQVPKGSVLVGDRIMTLEEWKREIKTNYVDSINLAD